MSIAKLGPESAKNMLSCVESSSKSDGAQQMGAVAQEEQEKRAPEHHQESEVFLYFIRRAGVKITKMLSLCLSIWSIGLFKRTVVKLVCGKLMANLVL